MATYVTVDGGTTNTRISLVKDRVIKDTLKFKVGARLGALDKALYKNTIKNGISDLLVRNGISETEVERILASGMITSDSGLYALEHITLPAGIKELKEASEEVLIPDVSRIPFVFVRGVRTSGGSLDSVDIMRGEETEIYGIAEDGESDVLYMLMGSHTKIIKLGEDGKISGFTTMLTGEMAAALSENTILKDAVNLNSEKLVEEYLLKGYRYSLEYGINEALFKVRILKNVFKKSASELYSFYIGVILSNEIRYVLKEVKTKVVVAGKRQLKNAVSMILKSEGVENVIALGDEAVDASVSKGLVKIYEYKD